MLKSYVPLVHPRLETLLTYFDKPLTVIYDHVIGIPSYLRAENGSAAIRIVRDAYCSALIEKLGRPITSTSANLTGQPFPKFFGEIQSDVMQYVDLIASYRREDRTIREPSVIIKCAVNREFEFVRE
jgi:L-threonylcarbamoyladenylate synthase